MKDSVLRDKTKDFAIKIINLMREIREDKKEVVITGQLLRSGTSIGANVREAHYAQGSLDFINKLEIALKECFESEYWLELLFETGYIEEQVYKKLLNECGVIRLMLIKSCKTMKGG